MVVGANIGGVHLLGHGGIHRAGGDRIDPDAHRTQLGRLLLGEVDQSGLAGAIGHPQQAGAKAGDRGNVDDAAAPAAQHHRRSGLGAQERPGEVDRDHPLPFLRGGLQQRLEHRDTGVVHQRIEPAEMGVQPLHRGGHLVFKGDVAGQREHARMLGQLDGGQGQCGRIDVQHRHAPAFGQEAAGHRETDAARGTGDQCHPGGCRHRVIIGGDRGSVGSRPRKAPSEASRACRLATGSSRAAMPPPCARAAALPAACPITKQPPDTRAAD